MLDFPILLTEGLKWTWILSGFMYFIIVAFYYKRAFTRYNLFRGYPKENALVIFVFVYCVLALYCGDWVHMQTIVKTIVGEEYQEGYGLERVYYILANLLDGNYLLFRTIVWGTGLICMMLSFKKSELDPYSCLFFLFCIYITDFAYTRAGVALAVFYCGFVYVFKNIHGHNTFSLFLGIALIIASIFLHRSMLPLVVLIPFVFFPINKRTICILLIALIILVFVWQRVFSAMWDYMLSSEEYEHRMELYDDLKGSHSLTFNLESFFFLWYKGVVHVPFWFCVIHLFKLINKKSVPFHIQAVFRFTILLYVFFMMMFIMYGSASAFYYRYESMIYIPITIMVGYLFQYGHITRSKYSTLFWICALSMCKDFIYRIILL